jgi:hypothetical protein
MPPAGFEPAIPSSQQPQTMSLKPLQKQTFRQTGLKSLMTSTFDRKYVPEQCFTLAENIKPISHLD